MAGDGTEGYDQARKIYLAEDAGIGCKDIAARGEALLEVVPQCDASHVEQGLGNAVGADAGQSAEDKHIDDGGHHGLDEIPQRTKDGLLIHGDDVATDVHPIEVAVTPETFNVYIQPCFLGLYFCNHINCVRKLFNENDSG